MKYDKIEGLDKDISKLIMGNDNQTYFDEAAKLWDHWMEVGGNAFDTAHIYGGGSMEKLLGEWHRKRNNLKDLVIVAKGAHTPNCDPKSISSQLTESLDRLQTETADIYIMHRDNTDIPVDEFIDVLNEEKSKGRVNIFGGSNWTLERFKEANSWADNHNKNKLSILNNNLALSKMINPLWAGCISSNDDDILDYLQENQVAHLSWSSQGRGYFLPNEITQKIEDKITSDESSWRKPGEHSSGPLSCYDSEDNRERKKRVFELAAKMGVDSQNIAGAWPIHLKFPSFALIGPRTIDELVSSLKNLEVELSDEKRRYDLESQIDDLLDDILSTIPTNERTKSRLYEIHKLLERFKELRKEYSVTDSYGTIIDIKRTPENFKPLLEQINPWNNIIPWIVPVIKNVKKLYDAPENEHLDDNNIIIETLGNTVLEEGQILDEYNTGNIPSENSRYNLMLMKISPFYKPHEFKEEDDSYTVEFIKDTDVLLDNENNLSTYVSIGGAKKLETSDIIKKQMVFDKYIEPFTSINIIKEKDAQPEIVRNVIGAYMLANMKSVILLDYDRLEYSKVLYPSTSIYYKSLYNPYYNYQILNKPPLFNFVEKESTDLCHTFKTSIQYIPESIDIYPFMDKIIPNTSQAFNIIKSTISGKLSLDTIIKQLNHFGITKNDIQYKDIEGILNFIRTKIEFDNKKRIEDFKLLSKHYNFTNNKFIDEKLYERLKTPTQEFSSLRQTFSEAYEIKEKSSDSLSSLVNILTIDSARLYTIMLSLLNINLYLTIDAETFIEESKQTPKKEQDECNQFVLTKQYKTLLDLENDNGKDIFYDKKYDITRYEIIEYYDAERKQMTAPNFYTYLLKKLKETSGLSEENAIKEADAMLIGARLVRDGEYCVLMEEGKFKYYKRENNEWKYDATIPNISPQNKDFCNIQPKCLEIKDECKDIESLSLNKLLIDFDKQYEIKLSEIKEKLIDQLNISTNHVKKINDLYREKYLEYNNLMYTSGLNFIDDISEISPSAKLMEIVLSEKDFVKRQENIVLFCNKFTREALGGESPYWMYCIQTSIKLLPTFLLRLAKTWNDNGDYIKELAIICKEQGKISNDGDCWVDQHSGYIIQKIDFDTDEGYEASGFKKISREILEEQSSDIVLAAPEKIVLDPETEIVYIVINALSKFLGIDIDNKLELITKYVLDNVLTAKANQAQYEKQAKLLKEKKGKTLPDYKEYVDQLIILFTLSYLVIFLECSIPSIKTRKTYPGCIKSFSGYPLDGKEDKTCIKYIACVAKKISSSIYPWKTIKKLKLQKLEDVISNNIEKYALADQTIIKMIELKKEYLATTDLEDIPDSLTVQRWTQFLPPLSYVYMENVQFPSDAFFQGLKSNIKTGNKKQFQDENILLAKQIYLSINILNKCTQIIKKEEALLVNSQFEPFLENSCCISKEPSTLLYFIKKDNEISILIDKVITIEKILYDINSYVKASTLVCELDTKLVYPPINFTFNETTIYLAMIHFCKFDELKPIPIELETFCKNKPANYNINDNLSEKITKLKQNGNNYNQETLTTILKLISTIIPNSFIEYDQDDQNLDQLKYYIEHGDATLEMNTKLLDIIPYLDDPIEKYPEKVNNLIDYLGEQNIVMLANIKNKIQNESNIALNIKRKVITFLESFEVWKPNTLTELGNYSTQENESIYRIINFIRNMLYHLVKVFPNIIIHKINYINSKIPSYWKFSDRHNQFLKKMLHDYYKIFEKYFDDENLINIFRKTDNTYYYELSEIIIKSMDSNKYVLDQYIILLILKSCVLHVINNYFEILENEIIIDPIILGDTDMQTEINLGKKANITKQLCNFIVDSSYIFYKSKLELNVTVEDIKFAINKSREREKKMITDRLKNLSEEERAVDTELKKNKLGQWNTGLQKGLTEYDPDFYDKETEAMEDPILTEELSLDYLPEDDDYGEMDGDEGF